MKLGTVMLYVGESDLEACARWYRDVLGFEISDAGESIWFGGEGNTGIGLHRGHEVPSDTRSSCTSMFPASRPKPRASERRGSTLTGPRTCHGVLAPSTSTTPPAPPCGS